MTQNEQKYRRYIQENFNGENINAKLLYKSNIRKGFFPLGDIAVDLKDLNKNNNLITPEQEFSTLLVSGAIDRPKDYELLYDNKYFVTDNPIEDNKNSISVWKPIPNEGFSSVGVIFKKGDFISYAPNSSHSSYTEKGCLILTFMRGHNIQIKK